jgi:ABC-type multidrug transport system ATPase subunit
MSDADGRINVMSLYQAGNGIYDLFDKVTVIADGLVLFYGPRTEARSYFESLGFEHMDGANTADYLTAVTSMTERRIRPGYEGKVPSTALELSAIYAQSAVCRSMNAELAAHLMNADDNTRSTEAALDRVRSAKRRGGASRSPTVTPFGAQIKAALIREYQQRWGSQL